MVEVGRSPIDILEETLGANWPNIRAARARSLEKSQDLFERLSSHIDDNLGVIVFGSLGRDEYTDYSDMDWTLLIDGPAKAYHYSKLNKVGDIVHEVAGKRVGEEATFGSMAFSHDILHRIGGNDDTNQNTTQRILLLLESKAISGDKVLSRVIKEVLTRYVTEDWGVFNKIHLLPRFLLNDIVRYWRTMCVDFAYKRRKRKSKGWAIRTVKLRLSRKLIYASGLLACYSCELDTTLREKIDTAKDIKELHSIMIDYLFQTMRKTPVDIISSFVLNKDSLYDASRKIFDSYDRFIEILQDKGKRDLLEELKPEETNTSVAYREARDMGHTFQEGLSDIFFDDKDLFKLTRKYGIF